ncbi:gliding motility-associated ABC transporter ATP-binding subunit GldA [Flavihumibacter cheonanensis]|uniref:gliding motility-associated ABC transporter ATP-binding subunit GldA n=1 Tax=Flavihumibacter cheonanensis TaxID=1442385 RepID=UPI001EF908A3|nr:gliding motility-associated ABC transporter ATP-binding subunit GldA [Flavihumibacter cheonanensis]MCG7754710.1 gliding motility-associated ABC transporter ATP-binding subunit GldA [Flavihumibacter cheonanensis]
MSIAVQSLKKVYGQQTAVNNISFSVNQGEIVGFLGPNGAGKSTTMKILTGYLQPDGGTALIAGMDVTKDPLATKSRIGYLPESNPLYYDMYVREYLQFMAEVHGIADKKGRINTVITQVGLTPESHKKIGQLSKGYKQRVGLAAALIHDPEVLILDEPTTGLDPNQIIEIREVIRSLGAQKTILFSTHILQEVEAVCSRVIIINKGNLIADNNLKDLQSSHSKPVIRVQFKEALEAQWLERAVTSLKELQKINAFEWQLEAADPVEAKKQLLALSVEQNLNIVSLQSSDQSLEDVFRSLTSS